jgi:hypothetical protein
VCLPFFIEAPFLRLSLLELLNYAWRRLSRAGQNRSSGLILGTYGATNDLRKLMNFRDNEVRR